MAGGRTAARDRSARGALKIATDDVHARLDAALSTFELGDVEAYGRFLAIHAAALPALEHGLARGGFAALLPEWEAGCRAPALRADLTGLGLRVPPSDPSSGPLSGPSSGGAIDLAEGAAWGTAYVLEGSRLGGKVLARRARAAGHPEVLANMRFLDHADGPVWSTFLRALETALRDEAALCGAMRGAHAAFAAFEAAAAGRR